MTFSIIFKLLYSGEQTINTNKNNSKSFKGKRDAQIKVTTSATGDQMEDKSPTFSKWDIRNEVIKSFSAIRLREELLEHTYNGRNK